MSYAAVMSVIPLTIAISLGLALGFVGLFLWEQRRGGGANAERDSLLPLAEESAATSRPEDPDAPRS